MKELINQRVILNYRSKVGDNNNQAATLIGINGTKIYIESEGQQFEVEKTRIQSVRKARKQLI